MAILFADGFDTYHRLQDVAARWSSNRTFDYNNSTSADLVPGRRAGGKAIILGDPNISNSGPGTSLYTTITPSSECVVAFAIKPDYNAAGTGNATSAYHPLVTFASGSTMFLRVVRHSQTGVIAAYLGGSDTTFHDVGTYAGATALTNSLNSLATGTTALVQTDWNHIQVVYKAADSGGSISVRLNGVEVWAFSGDTKPGTGTTFDTIAFYAGQAATSTSSADNAGAGVFVAHDDIVIATGTTPIGDAGVVALQANGNGNSTDWTATGTALGASKLSDATVTTGSSYTSGSTASLYDGLCGSTAGAMTLGSRTNVGTGTNAWVRADFGTATDIAGWRICQKANTEALITPIAYKLQGSADASTWTDLDSVVPTASNVAYDSGIRTITTANYRYFRFKVDASTATGSQNTQALTELELFPPLASTAFNQFAETPNLTSTYLQGDALNEIQLATFSDLGTTIGTVVAVQQRLIAGADSGSGTLIPVTRVGGTNYTGTSITVSGAGSDKTIVWDTNPATTTAWTRSEVNGAEFGAKVG